MILAFLAVASATILRLCIDGCDLRENKCISSKTLDLDTQVCFNTKGTRRPNEFQSFGVYEEDDWKLVFFRNQNCTRETEFGGASCAMNKCCLATVVVNEEIYRGFSVLNYTTARQSSSGSQASDGNIALVVGGIAGVVCAICVLAVIGIMVMERRSQPNIRQVM